MFRVSFTGKKWQEAMASHVLEANATKSVDVLADPAFIAVGGRGCASTTRQGGSCFEREHFRTYLTV